MNPLPVMLFALHAHAASLRVRSASGRWLVVGHVVVPHAAERSSTPAQPGASFSPSSKTPSRSSDGGSLVSTFTGRPRASASSVFESTRCASEASWSEKLLNSDT